MRILGFSKKWDKLKQTEFTTFRFPRKDKDWQIGEQVQIVYKPRSKERELLGIATIVNKEPKLVFSGNDPTLAIGDQAAREDGFISISDMQTWMWARYPFKRLWSEPMNKLTLKVANTASLLFSKRSRLPNTTKGGEHYRVDYLLGGDTNKRQGRITTPLSTPN